MDKTLKKVLLSFGAVGIFGIALISTMDLDTPLGGEADDIQYIVDTTGSTEADCLTDTGKYCQIASSTYNGINYRVFEYVTPASVPGYQLIFRKASGTDEYVRSIGYGPEAEGRTHDWCLINEEEY